MEDSYEKLEAKITGNTVNPVDFKNPEFITQAIGNLEAFESALSKASNADQGTINILNKVDKLRTDARATEGNGEEVKRNASGDHDKDVKIDTPPATTEAPFIHATYTIKK